MRNFGGDFKGEREREGGRERVVLDSESIDQI